MIDERIKKIAEHYGPIAQKEQLVEECAELILAAQKSKRNGDRESYENYCEEIADVWIMVSQMIYLISPAVIGGIINRKLDRQIQRIEAERE